jgi:dephospho-CoA kinase
MNKIKFTFGENIYYAGLLDLKKFDTNDKFNKLLDIIELDLVKSYEKWRIKNWNKFYTIFKSSILFERGLDKNMNFNITTFTPELQRKQDILNATQMPRETIDNILSNEMDELIKNQKATYVIHGYRGLSELRKSVNNVHKAIMNKNSQGVLHNDDSSAKNIFS